MRSGKVYEPPMLGHRMEGSECSSLPRGTQVFDTPDTMPDAPNSGSNRRSQPAGLGNQVKLLRTPTAVEAEGGLVHPEKARRENRTVRLGAQILAMTGDLLPTPNTMDMLPRRSDEALARAKSKGGCSNLKDAEIVRDPSEEWGRYEPAVKRWEAVLGREAPAPTQESVRGKPQLAPAFVEWMMGLEKGWVTDPEIGLSRNEQLRMLGNGVVPQQALLALEKMKGQSSDSGC